MYRLLKVIGIYQGFGNGAGSFYGNLVFFQFRRHAVQHFPEEFFQIRLFHGELGQLRTAVQLINAAVEILAALDEVI